MPAVAVCSRRLPVHLLLSALLLAPPGSPAVKAPASFTAPTGGLRGLWTDGDGLLAVIEYRTVDLSCRTGERVRLEHTERLVDVAGAWVDGGPVIAAAAVDGALLVWRAGAWSVIRAPVSDEHDTIAVAVDERGRVLVASGSQGVHRLDGARWDSFLYPPELSSARYLAARGDGEFVLAGSYGRLLHAPPGEATLQLRRVGRSPSWIGAAWIGATGPLWLAGDGALAAIDPGLARTTTWVDLPMTSVQAMTGLPDGSLLAIAEDRGVVVYDGARATSVTDTRSVTGLGFDLRGAALLVASGNGMIAVPIDAPALLAARARMPAPAPCPLPAGTHVQSLADRRPVPKASPTQIVPDVLHTAPQAVPFATKPLRERMRATLRLGLGPAFSPGAAPPISTGFNLDVALGIMAQVRPRVYLWPELGYSYNGRGGQPGHFVIAGITPLFGKPMAQIGVAARLVAGDAWHVPGAGLRSGLVASFVHHALTFELGHQWLRAGGRDLHDGRLVISVDLVITTRAFVAVMAARSIFRGTVRWLRRR